MVFSAGQEVAPVAVPVPVPVVGRSGGPGSVTEKKETCGLKTMW